ncbi:MAG: hypothetical protein IPL23_10765 [Saprospiraceae bacterium]|nr:hypothetical protein [Saprospiraceae bacterium]
MEFGKDRSKGKFIFLQIKDDENSFQYDKSYTTSYGYPTTLRVKTYWASMGLTLFKK